MTVLASDVMKDSARGATDVRTDSAKSAGVSPGTFDFDFLVARANDLGAENDEQRAEKAGISVSTYYRLQRGDANLTLRTVGEIATSLKTTTARLMGMAP